MSVSNPQEDYILSISYLTFPGESEQACSKECRLEEYLSKFNSLKCICIYLSVDWKSKQR